MQAPLVFLFGLLSSLLILLLFALCFLSKIANHFSFYSPIYSFRWVEALWLFPDLTRVDGGPIPSFLSGCSVGNGGSGIGTGSHLQKMVRQQYSPRQYRDAKNIGCSRQLHSRLCRTWPARACFWCVQGKMGRSHHLGPIWALRHVRT